MAPSSGLAPYLRARRDLVQPGDVGLPTVGRRRVPGLRREALATRAGISVDYYMRLEQGHDHHPSREVLDALARALRLDEDATRHLHLLADPPASRRLGASAEVAHASIRQLITTWPIRPAMIQGLLMDVLDANAAARALSPIFTPGTNIVRATFLEPSVRRLVPDWELAAETAVASLRARIGADVEDPRLAELVGELSERSSEFRRLWAHHDVRPATHVVRCLDHPAVGRLHLHAERLPIPDTDGQQLVIYHAQPGSPTERALRRLSRTAAMDDAGEARSSA